MLGNNRCWNLRRQKNIDRKQAIGTARFGQKAKFWAPDTICLREPRNTKEALPETQTLSPSLRETVDARYLAVAQERRLDTASRIVCKMSLYKYRLPLRTRTPRVGESWRICNKDSVAYMARCVSDWMVFDPDTSFQ